MLMDLFFFWSILSLAVLAYVIVFPSMPAEVTSPMALEPQAEAEPTILVRHKTRRVRAIRKNAA